MAAYVDRKKKYKAGFFFQNILFTVKRNEEGLPTFNNWKKITFYWRKLNQV
jgi:hypothetical protein